MIVSGGDKECVVIQAVVNVPKRMVLLLPHQLTNDERKAALIVVFQTRSDAGRESENRRIDTVEISEGGYNSDLVRPNFNHG